MLGIPYGVLFPSLYALLFAIVGTRFYWSFRQTKSRVALYISISCLLFALSVGLTFVAYALYPNNLALQEFWGHKMSDFLTLIGFAFLGVVDAYLFLPSTKPQIIFLLGFAYSSLFLAAMYLGSYVTDSANHYPISHLNAIALSMHDLLVAAVSLPLLVSFIRESARKRNVLKALCIMIGLLLLAFFEPLTYENAELPSYLLFNALALIGFAFMLTGVFIKNKA